MSATRKPKTTLKFIQPPQNTNKFLPDVLVCGNGHIGASVYGGAIFDRLALSTYDLSWQGKAGVLPDVFDKTRNVRKFLASNDFRAAEIIVPEEFNRKNYRPKPASLLPVCDLKIAHLTTKAATDYARYVNCETGEVSVTYTCDGAKYERSVFISRKEDLIVLEFNQTGKKLIDAEFRLDMHDLDTSVYPEGRLEPQTGTVKYENTFAYFYAKNNDTSLDYGAVMRITTSGGVVESGFDCIRVRGANTALVMIKLFAETQKDKAFKEIKAALAANKNSYDKSLSLHTALHQKAFMATDLDLNAESRDKSVEELLAMSGDKLVPALLEKLYFYGKNLFISQSREDGCIPTKFGPWAVEYYNRRQVLSLASSFEQVYAFALAAGQPNLMLPAFDFFEKNYDDLKKNAMRLQGCRGVFVPRIMAPETALLGATCAGNINYATGAGIIALLYYNYYLATGDAKFLKTRALPFLKDAAVFYEDFFKFDGAGKASAGPTYSFGTTAQNLSDGGRTVVSVHKDTAADFAVAKEVLLALAAGSEELQMNKNDVARWREFAGNLPDYEMTSDGTVKEFLTQNLTENSKSPYTAHLSLLTLGADKGIYDAKILAAFAASFKERASLPSHTSETLANAGLGLAAAGLVNDALKALTLLAKNALTGGGLALNLGYRGLGGMKAEGALRYAVPVNIAVADTINGLFAASKNGFIKLNNVYDTFKKFKLEGVLTKAGAVLGLEYNGKELAVSLKAVRNIEMILDVPAIFKKVKGTDAFDAKEHVCKIKLTAGKSISFKLF